MSEVKHGLIKEFYYSIILNTSNRIMPSKLDDFLSGFDLESLGDDWYDYHTIIRDYEGDFEGIEIHFNETIEPLYLYISDKLCVSRLDIADNKIRIACI